MKTDWQKIRLLLLLTILLMAVSGMTEGQVVQFHWGTCPPVSESGQSLAEVVEYRVWLSRDGGPDDLLATVDDQQFEFYPEPGVSHRIRVQGVDENGLASVKSEWSVELEGEGYAQNLETPAAGLMKPNFPNPFNPATNISYQIPTDLESGDRVSLEVFDLAGRLVRQLQVQRSPGWHEVVWDGRDERGLESAAGLYISRLTVGAMVATKKMTMVK